jgi:hypothetical protein
VAALSKEGLNLYRGRINLCRSGIRLSILPEVGSDYQSFQKWDQIIIPSRSGIRLSFLPEVGSDYQSFQKWDQIINRSRSGISLSSLPEAGQTL